MPELPEVETVARSLQKQIAGKKITSTNIIYPKILGQNSMPLKKLHNNQILSVDRRAKYIIVNFDSMVMAVHLRMTGKLFIADEINKKHIHLTLKLNTDELSLIHI